MSESAVAELSYSSHPFIMGNRLETEISSNYANYADYYEEWDEADEEECPDCHGTGLDKWEEFDCETCGGEGYISSATYLTRR